MVGPSDKMLAPGLLAGGEETTAAAAAEADAFLRPQKNPVTTLFPSSLLLLCFKRGLPVM